MSNRLFCVEVDGTAMYGRHAKNPKELARVIAAALTQWPKSKKVAIVALSRQFYNVDFYHVSVETAKNDPQGVAARAFAFYEEQVCGGLNGAERTRNAAFRFRTFIENKRLWTRHRFRFVDSVVFGDGTLFDAVSLEEAEALDKKLMAAYNEVGVRDARLMELCQVLAAPAAK